MEIVIKSLIFLVTVVSECLICRTDFRGSHKVFSSKIFSFLMNEGKSQNPLHCFSSLTLA